MLLDVEEVGAAEVLVALVVAGVDAGDVDLHFDAGPLRYLVDRDGARHGREPTPDLGDHEMAPDELDGGMRGVDGVLAGDGDLAVLVSAKDVQCGLCHVPHLLT